MRYRARWVSRLWLQSFPARHRRMLFLLFPLAITLLTCEVNRRPPSIVTPRNLYSFTIRTTLRFSFSCGFHFRSFWSDEMINASVLSAFNLIFHVFAQPTIASMDFCIRRSASDLLSPTTTQTAVSSANKLGTVLSSSPLVISLINIRNSRGEIAEPCGNPSLRYLLSDLVPFTSTHVFLALRNSLVYLTNL